MGLQFDIPILMPVDDNGVLHRAMPARSPALIPTTPTPSSLIGCASRARSWPRSKISHSYPHCWRCHEPVIFRATDQWFVSMEENGLREQGYATPSSAM